MKRTADVIEVMEVVFVQVINDGGTGGLDEFVSLAMSFPAECDTSELIFYLSDQLASADPARSYFAKLLIPQWCPEWKDRASIAARAVCP